MTDHTTYSPPLDVRLDHTRLRPGDLTALMAVPWQADFSNCIRSWWPSQRPGDVLPSATATAPVRWERGLTDHIGMINNFAKLGFIAVQEDGQGNIVFAEEQRAPVGR